jgi:hypothetical protein
MANGDGHADDYPKYRADRPGVKAQIVKPTEDRTGKHGPQEGK